MHNFVIRSRAYSTDLRQAAVGIENAAWSKLGFLNYTKAHRELYDDLLETYADLQICLVDPETDLPVAAANCVPIPDIRSGDLPQEGWDWLVETGSARRERPAKLLGALAISVPAEHQRRGFARLMIRALRELAEARGYEGVVAPVRPSAKSEHPCVPIDDYIGWKDDRGRVFDPWLRAHLGEGGRVVGPCERSMVVDEHIAFWETWAGRRLTHSGDYILDGALTPIVIDLEAQTGRYEEPNVWVTYSS